MRSVKPVIICAAAVLGLVAYFALPAMDGNADTVSPDEVSGRPSIQAQQTPSTIACSASPKSQVSSASVAEIHNRAVDLAEQKQFGNAVAALRSVALLDAAYPGINLDLSTSLLQWKKFDEAKTEADSQIRTSECLANLPASDLVAYCKSELPNSSTASCKQRLETIRQNAYLQIATLNLETVEAPKPKAGALPKAVADTTKPKVVRQAPADEDDEVADMGPFVKPSNKVSAGKKSTLNSYMKGEGTDAELGAYSK